MSKKENNVLSQEAIENIKNYESEIITIDNWVEAVRQNIGMWIGSRGFKGHLNMIREIIQNGLDEIMKDSSPATGLKVSYDEASQILICEDNGRGIPFNLLVKAFTDMNTSSNYNKKPGEYSSGLHGCGAKVTNALSEFFYVESYILGDARRVEFNDGWALVRYSNTGPVISARFEANSNERLKEINDEFMSLINKNV